MARVNEGCRTKVSYLFYNEVNVSKWDKIQEIKLSRRSWTISINEQSTYIALIY